MKAGWRVGAVQVDALHAQYCAAVQALFDNYKGMAGYEAEERLKIV